MVFVDGENLAIRFGQTLDEASPPAHVSFRKDAYVWSMVLDEGLKHYELVRKYYYTSALGDEVVLTAIEDELRSIGVDAPRVFKRTKSRGSKRVDIALVTDLLSHAYRDNFDIAVLVSGDEDFVPAVNAVTAEGKIVVVWAFSAALSPALRRSADYWFDLSGVLFASKEAAWDEVFHR